MNQHYLFTSESVSEGHPDKVADQISDLILDGYLAFDPDAKVACETLVTHLGVIVAGEIFSSFKFGEYIPSVIKKLISDIGYNNDAYGYDSENIWINNYLHEQSHEIRQGVDEGGAGDQGMMFGYACNETEDLMPLPIWLSHRIMERQAKLRKEGMIQWLLPDAKSQVTVVYENNVPIGIDTILVSTQHMPMVLTAQDPMHGWGYGHHGHYSAAYMVSAKQIRERVIDEIIMPVIPAKFKNNDIKFLVNPSGSFTIGGPAADTGLTGRKIVVDTYGGSCPHGGGAFSGKDPSKVDRSAAYAARYIAKNVVAAGLADKCMVQLSYAIGKAEPVSFMLEFFGTGRTDEAKVENAIKSMLDLTPNGIIEKFQLKRPIYLKTSVYGHFGRNLPEFTWEKIDLVNYLTETFR
jgi:S-adenosylmethionine synthetase